MYLYINEGYGNRQLPKVAHITGLACREIERGLFAPLSKDIKKRGAIDVLAEIQEIQEQLDPSGDYSWIRIEPALIQCLRKHRKA